MQYLQRLVAQLRGQLEQPEGALGNHLQAAALTAKMVTCVEMNPAVRPFFLVNSILNDVEGRIELRLGDLLGPVAGDRFDHICCNPPLLPVPAEVEYPFVGDGGPDGLSVVKRVLNGAPELLTEHGRCQIVGTLLGDETGPELSEFTRAAEAGLVVTVILPSRLPIREGAESLAVTASQYSGKSREAVRQTLLSVYTTHRHSHIYSYLLLARRQRLGEPHGVSVIRHYQRASRPGRYAPTLTAN